MFNDTKVNHKKYGYGVITSFDMDSIDELNSKITVRFDDETEKKFPLHIFNKFFTTDNSNIVELVEDLLKRKEEERLNNVVIEEIKEYNPADDYSREDWEKAYKVAEEHRFKYESRAVIMDDDIIFLSASDALKYIESDPRKGDEIYAACELSKKHKMYLHHEWRYATKAEIKLIIDRFEVTNDSK